METEQTMGDAVSTTSRIFEINGNKLEIDETTLKLNGINILDTVVKKIYEKQEKQADDALYVFRLNLSDTCWLMGILRKCAISK